MTPEDTHPESEYDATPDAASGSLGGQAYDIIRKRLDASGNELRERLDRLNRDRKEVFGSIETSLLATKRITTENHCVPRDMIEVGHRFLFGFNVHVGLRRETKLEDVFAVFRYEGDAFHAEPFDLIDDGSFRQDFAKLYKYYKQTQFARFAVLGPHLFMVFRVGQGVDDIKTFKWLIDGDALRYVDNRSDHEFRYPSQHEFEWVRATRDQHRSGRHPHISIDERLFVETVGGDLTLKVENNTDVGEGIYAEPVDDPDQTLDDAEVYYALVGNIILLKIRPYQESAFRYLLYNEKIKQAMRIDAIEDACVLLPDDHGVIFPKGYYLQSGQSKTFDLDATDLVFTRRMRATNGEDFLYVFYNRMDGTYVLLAYNLIEQEVATPLVCAGVAMFPDGKALLCRHPDEPENHHAIQVWQTPFASERETSAEKTDSLLYKIGNRDLVRGMAECHEVLNLLAKEDTYGNLYADLVKRTTDLIDATFWIDSEVAYHLKDVLVDIRDTATQAINEFDKVVRVRKNTQNEVARVTKATSDAIATVRSGSFDAIGDFVASLATLRRLRGEIIALRDLRYVDHTSVDALETDVRENSDRLAVRCVEFLLEPASLQPYETQVETEHAKIEGLATVHDAKEVEEKIAAVAGELEMLIEIVSNLKIDDATERTEIIDGISTIFSRLNQTRASLKSKTQALMATEGAAEFHSQLKLLNQAVVNYLDICDSPEKCEEYLTKIMVQIEEAEGRFSEFDDFILQLSEKRDEIYNAFEARRLALVEGRNRRAGTLLTSAERILKGITTRVGRLESIQEIHGYFASDLMVEKVRDIVAQLTELEDSVKVDDILSRLKTVQEDAVRQLKDRHDLYSDGGNIIQLGRHRFTVNVQELDLTTVLRDGKLCFHLTGTNFFQPVEDEALLATRDVWQQEAVSENDTVYRSEYLAYLLLQSLGEDGLPTLDDVAAMDEAECIAFVQQFMGPRYSEGYIKGVHDHDAALHLRALVDLRRAIGLLRYGSPARAAAGLFWRNWSDKQRKPILTARLKGFGTISALFSETTAQADCIAELQQRITPFLETVPGLNVGVAHDGGEYLFHELATNDSMVISREASDILQAFQEKLELKSYQQEFAATLQAVGRNDVHRFLLARDWIRAFLAEQDHAEWLEFADEAASLLAEGEYDESRVVHTPTACDVTGLLGSHSIIEEGQRRLSYTEFMSRVTRFAKEVVPQFELYTRLKRECVDAFREELRLEEFRPRVLTSFVRNRLIDEVYLPLIGDNLAKQIGAAGDDKRTDRMGMLMLISPPGYGKTTLMEYMANRLGIIFMKINGPAIGHRVVSLDPDEAPNASAREEIEKLNLALEMGDNLMIYLDDIQHCNPEFLQKFISLCDAQRKIEGVYNGRTRTYDLRGRKVCVVMAGNPYTESGEKFQIPDMLANRADTYNLGEMIGDNGEVFEMSYLENSLTANPTLTRLAAGSRADIHALLRRTNTPEPIDLEGNYSLDEINEMVATLQKMIRVRDVILAVNREYIRSAAQADAYRTEPPFKLQGSYRNMNRIAEKVSPMMNDEELQTVIMSAYENDAQTLTTGAEANLLKFKELTGMLTDEEATRWHEIRRTFKKNLQFRGVDSEDKFGQVIAQMGVFSDGLDSIRDTLAAGAARMASDDHGAERFREMAHHLGDFKSSLDAIRDSLASGVEQLQKVAAESPEGPAQLTATFDSVALQSLERIADAAARGTSQEIKVVNKVPRVILGVVREQFNLMQAWLAPLVSVAESQRSDMKHLKERIDAALSQYGALVEKLEGDQE